MFKANFNYMSHMFGEIQALLIRGDSTGCLEIIMSEL